MRLEVARFLAEEYPVDFPDAEVIISLGLRKFRITEVPAQFRVRVHGSSMYSKPGKSIILSLQIASRLVHRVAPPHPREEIGGAYVPSGKTRHHRLALLNIVFVVELLRKRKLSESYTLMWLFVIGAVIFFTWAERFLSSITSYFGAITPVSTLTLLSLLFILVMLIFFSMKIYKMERLIKEMAQRAALDNPKIH